MSNSKMKSTVNTIPVDCISRLVGYSTVHSETCLSPSSGIACSGDSAMMTAICLGHVESARTMYARIPVTDRHHIINSRDCDSMTPLVHAIYRGYTNVLDFLIGTGVCDVNMKVYDVFKRDRVGAVLEITPLYFAMTKCIAIHNLPHVVHELLRNGASWQVTEDLFKFYEHFENTAGVYRKTIELVFNLSLFGSDESVESKVLDALLKAGFFITWKDVQCCIESALKKIKSGLLKQTERQEEFIVLVTRNAGLSPAQIQRSFGMAAEGGLKHLMRALMNEHGADAHRPYKYLKIRVDSYDPEVFELICSSHVSDADLRRAKSMVIHHLSRTIKLPIDMVQEIIRRVT